MMNRRGVLSSERGQRERSPTITFPVKVGKHKAPNTCLQHGVQFDFKIASKSFERLGITTSKGFKLLWNTLKSCCRLDKSLRTELEQQILTWIHLFHMWVLFPARQFSTGIEKSSFFLVLEQESFAQHEIDLPLISLKGRLYCGWGGVDAGAGHQVVEDITCSWSR